MTRRIPYTAASLARAIKGVELAGRFVVGVKPDGTLIVGDKPIETASLVPASTENTAASKWDQLGQPARRFGDRLAEQTQSAPAKKRARRSTWGVHVEITDPELIAKYRAAGAEVYDDGEWEGLVRAEPMGKREARALGGYFTAKGEPIDVSGAGLQINQRLRARGYLEIVNDCGKEFYRITAAGEAEWLRMESGKAPPKPARAAP